MKRGKPLERRIGLKRGEGLKRKTELARAAKKRTGRSSPRRERQPAWWTEEVRGLPCVCGRTGCVAVHGHHIVPAQMLRALGVPVWDRANRMPVAIRCHLDHHYHPDLHHRFSLARDHPVRAYAEALAVTWYLEKTYRVI